MKTELSDLEYDIDRYVLDEMSDAEKASFEENMSSDPVLGEYVRLRYIEVEAVRDKEALKDEFMGIEASLRNSRRVKRRNIVIAISSFAAAACLAAGLFIRAGQVQAVKAIGESVLLADLQQARGGMDFSSIIADIDSGRFREALDRISEYREAPAPEFDISTEKGRYERDLYVSEMLALDYFEAVVYMRDGRPCKARRLLKELAAGEVSYWQQAAESLLEKL